jgi:hypothetical protein
MQSLSVDLVVIICGPDELFRLYLVNSCFREMLDKEDVVKKLIASYNLNYYTGCLPSSPLYFVGTVFGRFVHRYDTMFVSSRVGRYFLGAADIMITRLVLSAAIDVGRVDVVTRVQAAGGLLRKDMACNRCSYIAKAVVHDHVDIFAILYEMVTKHAGKPEVGAIIKLVLKNTSVKIAGHMVEIDNKYSPDHNVAVSAAHSADFDGDAFHTIDPEGGITGSLFREARRCGNTGIMRAVSTKLKEMINKSDNQFCRVVMSCKITW